MKCQSKIRTTKLSISWVGILLDARPKHLSLDSHVVFSFLFCLILADLILADHMALVLEEAILVLKESQPLVGLILVGLIRRTQSW